MKEWNPSEPRSKNRASQLSSKQEQFPESQEQRRQGRWEWWYRRTTPPEPTGRVSRAEREKARRARLASTLLLIISVIWLLAIPFFFITVSGDPATLPITLVGLLSLALLLFFTRRGWTALVAWILIALIYLSVVLILQKQGSLNTTNVAVFDLLIYCELIAVSLLPAISVFLVAFSSCALILVALFSLRLPPDAFAQPAFVTNVVAEPLTLQVFVAVVVYLWVASNERAMARADQAELVAALERRRAEERRQLQEDIQQLLATLTTVANGDASARVALSQDHALWQVGMALNTLLARQQRANQAEQALQVSAQEVALLVSAIREFKAGRPPRWPAPSGGLVDPLIRELVGSRRTSAPSPSHPTANASDPPEGSSSIWTRPRRPEE